MKEYSVDTHLFPMSVTFDREHHTCNKVELNTPNSLKEVIISFIGSRVKCGGNHKVWRQSDVKHNDNSRVNIHSGVV